MNESVVDAAAMDYFEGMGLSAIKMKHKGKYQSVRSIWKYIRFYLDFDYLDNTFANQHE